MVLLGWVHRVRDLGGVTFIDIRDRAGVSQVVVRENDALMAVAKRLRSEFVVGVTGVVQRRSEDTVNPKLATGEVEVLAREIRILNEAKTPPFQIAEDAPVSEDVRLRYRYLDLRRPRLQHNIGLRHRVAMAVRKYFDAQRLLGDRDADSGEVDARRRARLPRAEPRAPGRVLRAAAVAADLQADPDDCRHRSLLPDRRAASATRISAPTASSSSRRSTSRCRSRAPDTDLRADRAADAARSSRRSAARSTLPFRRMPYAEAIAKYGSDKPDLRCGLEIPICPRSFGTPSFACSSRSSPRAASVRGFAVPGGNSYSRSQLDVLVDQAKQMGFTRPDLGPARRAAAQLGEGARARRRCGRRSTRAGARPTICC